ncbi:sigma-70 family RNA polymerase sigma factor, partial [Singulisphaera acidiphila]
MTRLQPAVAFRQMRALFGLGAAGGLTDEHLLEIFSTGQREAAEAAFATLAERHGPMVLRVCQGVLGDSHDVHDAFQATFLVLVRKAGSLWIRDSLGPWLHGVALRVATKAKVAAIRRQTHERRAAEAGEATCHGEYDGHASTLHEEIDKLPQKYRAPIVLCYLEGLTHEGAATALNWPVGTVRGRLARARDLLRTRLIRRGLVPSAATLGAILTAEGASAAPLSEPSIRTLLSLVAERSAGLAPAAVAALADGCLRMMTMARLKIATVLLLVAFAALGLAEAARTKSPGGDHRAVQAPLLARANADADGPAKPTPPESWPAGVEVKGRVVDHDGAAVAGADILLLGSEQLTVYANAGAKEGQVRSSIATQPANAAPSVKTDGQGRFSLRRSGSPANRIAVVSAQMLLWEVTRKEFADANNLLITLPKPVALTLHAEIPEKPAKQEFWMTGRLLNRVDWESDSVFYREIQVPNPGQRIVGSLPPAQYAIERINFTPQGRGSNLMTQCERRLLPIEPGKRVDVTFDRKIGRRIEGRVRGLENVKLRYAMVSIGFFGPEEQFSPGGKKSSLVTHFDVLSIGPDGRFATPLLPPNRYEFELSAMRATTPNQDGQSYDGERLDSWWNLCTQEG